MSIAAAKKAKAEPARLPGETMDVFNQGAKRKK
jgi:hypothetical protein